MLGLKGVELVRESALRRNFFLPAAPGKVTHPSSEFSNSQKFMILTASLNQ